MQDAHMAELPEPALDAVTALERRRPDRVNYANPALVKLLRDPTQSWPQPDAPGSSSRQTAASGSGEQAGGGFVITDFDRLHPRPGDPRREASNVRSDPETAAIDIAAAQRYCQRDTHWRDWTCLLAAQVGRIQHFIASDEYPKSAPSADSINALIARLVSLSRFLRRLCLVSGRDGTPQANRAVTEAICSLACQPRVPGAYGYWSDLRRLCASLCFYWAIAGAIARHDFTTASGFMHAPIARDDGEEPLIAVLPLLTLGAVDWTVVKGLETCRTPASEFLFRLFRAEIADASLDPGATDEDLFDRLEFLISLEFAHMRLRRESGHSPGAWFWVPLGRYVCNLDGRAMLDRLAGYERLPADHALLKAGLLGGTPAGAAQAVGAMRERLGITCHGAGF